MLIFIPRRLTNSDVMLFLLFHNLFPARETAERKQLSKLYRSCTCIKVRTHNLLASLTSGKQKEKSSLIKRNSV